MATLGQVGELATTQLRDRVGQLVEAVEEEKPDFAEVSALADSVGELADRIGDIYREVEQQLIGGMEGDSGSDGDNDDEPRERQQPRQSSRGRQQTQQRQQRQRQSQNHDSAEDDVTKDELLERAREVNVQGRSSMNKDELAEAVEVEESRTKDELLERAQEAEIEGRSSMTKDELRKALNEAGA